MSYVVYDNPGGGGSQFEALGKIRRSFERVVDLVQPNVKWAAPSIKRKKNKETGEITESLSGGPYAPISPKFLYTSAKGAQIPFGKSSIFTWTTKMSCPSFSIMAGPPKSLGTCPAATKSVVAAEGSYVKFHEPMNGQPYICDACLTGDMKIPVKGMGLIPMSTVVDLFEDGVRFDVLSDSGWTKVTNVFRKGIQRVVKISSTCGMTVRCTPDHKILTTDGWKEAKDLEDGDRLVLGPSLVSADNRWPMKSCQKVLVTPTQDELDRSERAPEYPTSLIPSLGLVAGYILGNGAIYYGKYPTVSISGHSDDIDDLRKITSLINQWVGSEASVSTLPKANPVTLKTGQEVVNNEKSTSVSWRKLGLIRLLDAIGLDKRPSVQDRRAPSSVWTSPEGFVTGFLQGIFSTDGSVVFGQKTAIILASVSKGLLLDVQLLLSNYGIRSTICPYKTSNVSRVDAGYHSLYKLEIGAKDSVATFRDRIGFHNERKNALLTSADLEYVMPLRSRRYAVVSSVTEELEAEEVYDIEVEHDDHRFIANGICVSNCYAGKGNYFTYPSVTISQLARLAWAEESIRRGTFVDQMVESIRRLQDPKVQAVLARKLVSTKFFRIHDAGDFHVESYYKAWVDVCRTLPGIHFWAPTRMWVFPKWRAIFASYPAPSNFSLRPSALFIEAKPPIVPNMAAGSMSRPGDALKPIWNCPAYKYDEHSCASAGCRKCWTSQAVEVNYKTH